MDSLTQLNLDNKKSDTDFWAIKRQKGMYSYSGL